MQDMPSAVRLTAEEIETTLDSLDAAVAAQNGERRRALRACYRRSLPAKIVMPFGLGNTWRSVSCRNVSLGGVAFLFGGSVCGLTRCRIRVPTRQRSQHEIGGTVVGCRRVGSSLYELGVRFDLPLNERMYCLDP